jgi:hypothetical protein
VLPAINLDDERTIMANEVKNVSSEGHLTAEAQSAETMRSQGIPKLALRPRHLTAKRLCLALLRC